MIQSDEPINDRSQDVLGRDSVAAIIAGEIRSIDAAAGSVVAILGPWGAGKTSLINLIRANLAGPPWIRWVNFNPWLFSGGDQLIDRFFGELAAQLRPDPKKGSGLADAIEDYGDIVAPFQHIPVLDSWVGLVSGAGKGLKELRAKRRGGVQQQRERVSRELRSLDSPIVVVIDDIDRLGGDEIRDIFKLVRLTGNFPNIIYLLAFDRGRIERALDEEGFSGRDYLEKIVQIVHDIPAIPEAVLIRQITEAIDNAIIGMEVQGPAPFDPARWGDVLPDIIRPLVRSMRDVRRYAGSLRGTVLGLDGEVELVDILALEAMRVFLPDVFALAIRSQDALTTPSSGTDMFDTFRDARSKPAIDAMIAAGDNRAQVVRAIVERLFPAAARYLDGRHSVGDSSLLGFLKARRVAHPDIFALYRERVVGSGLLAFKNAEQAFDLLDNQGALDHHMRSLDPTQWQDVISTLEAYQEEFPADAAVPATVVFLNLGGEVPERAGGFLEPNARMVIIRVVYRLLRRLEDATEIEAAVREILPQSTTLRGKLALLNLVGREKDLGQELIGEHASQELEAQLRHEIRAAEPDVLGAERQLLWLITWTKRTRTSQEPPFELPVSKVLGSVLLKESVSVVRRYGSGTRAVETEKRFQLDELVEAVGSTEQVRSMVELCRQNATDDALLADALELAEKYLGGWRPDRF